VATSRLELGIINSGYYQQIPFTVTLIHPWQCNEAPTISSDLVVGFTLACLGLSDDVVAAQGDNGSGLLFVSPGILYLVVSMITVYGSSSGF
jgi:hypothetical protein